MDFLNSENSLQIEIPPIFYSDSSEQKFLFCLECNKFLLEPDTPYYIEKYIKHYKKYQTTDTLIEYAICLSCSKKLKQSYSKKSIKLMEEYFAENFDVTTRLEKMQNITHDGVESLISHCIIKNIERDKLENYQLIGLCMGEKLIIDCDPYENKPFILSEYALNEMLSPVSKKTRAAIDAFLEKHFGIPNDFGDFKSKFLL